jgi:prevent-host-death family protein
MARQHSIAEARNSLPSLVREAESGKTVELTRRGEPVAVLLGRRQYERLTSEYRRFSHAYEDFAREVDLEELALDPDELFAGARDDLQGREVKL